MSNKLVNAVIALVENRPEIARSLLRSPELKDISISDVHTRLFSAIDSAKARAVATSMKIVLNQTLRIVPDPKKTPAEREAFLEGVATAETYLEAMIEEAQSHILAKPNTENAL